MVSFCIALCYGSVCRFGCSLRLNHTWNCASAHQNCTNVTGGKNSFFKTDFRYIGMCPKSSLRCGDAEEGPGDGIHCVSSIHWRVHYTPRRVSRTSDRLFAQRAPPHTTRGNVASRKCQQRVLPLKLSADQPSRPI